MNNTMVVTLLLSGLVAPTIYATDPATAPKVIASAPAPTTPLPTPPAGVPEAGGPMAILAVRNGSGSAGAVGLNDLLQVQVGRGDPPTPIAQTILDANKYALFINGREVKGLADATYDRDHQSLIYDLRRNDANKDLWTELLGSPSLVHPTVQATVALGERSADAGKAPRPTIVGLKGSDTLNLKVFGPVRLAIAAFLIAGAIWLVFARARKNTTLRDNLIPQIAPSQQTYSLARCQMAFWFVLIFCAFVFLYIATWDYNTISQQALILMGISGATALTSIAIDVAKDSPADAVNRGLQALGFNSFDDVLRVQKAEIPVRTDELTKKTAELARLPQPAPGTPPASLTPQEQQWLAVSQRITQLTLEINDRKNRLATYEAQIPPFVTQGFFKDVTTDINGTALHRLQVFCWTLVLGGVFLIGVYRDLAMPEFGGTLLALMGISSAGYVGFKYPEKNN